MRDSSVPRQRRNWLRASLGLGVAAFGATGLRTAGTAVAGPGTVAAAAADVSAAVAERAPLQWQERVLLGFGTTLSLRAAHVDGGVLRAALDDAIAEIRAIEQQMSLFDPDSALSRLNAGGILRHPDNRLLEVLGLARQVAQRSDGAFDVTMQPLWRAWQLASSQNRLASREELSLARARVDWRKLDFDVDAVRLRAPGMAVSLNGIAQGYAADRARHALQMHGIEHALLDTGEWAPLGRADPATPWRLGIADPHRHDALIATLVTDGRCIASSSDDRTVFSADHRHHHIVDPRLGLSPQLLSGVTVAASSGALADALTKVFFMAETQLGKAVRGKVTKRTARTPRFDPQLAQVAAAIARTWKVDALLVDKQGAWWASAGFPLR